MLDEEILRRLPALNVQGAAARRRAAFQRSGEAVDFGAMRRCAHELAAGRKPAAPRARRILP